jgi:hypothetical protein
MYRNLVKESRGENLNEAFLGSLVTVICGSHLLPLSGEARPLLGGLKPTETCLGPPNHFVLKSNILPSFFYTSNERMDDVH